MHMKEITAMKKITVLEANRSKRIQEIQRQKILPNYKGDIMHDHETGLYNFGKGLIMMP